MIKTLFRILRQTQKMRIKNQHTVVKLITSTLYSKSKTYILVIGQFLTKHYLESYFLFRYHFEYYLLPSKFKMNSHKKRVNILEKCILIKITLKSHKGSCSFFVSLFY